jgi:hypothetical protein
MPDSGLLLPEAARLLHIGFPKTGTTSLQSALEVARKDLPAYGVVYPGTERYHKNASIAAVDAIVRIGERPPDRAHWDELVKETARAGDKRVIISSEWFSEAKDDTARTIVDQLGGERAHIVVTLRPLSKILPSSWQQYLKNGVRTSYAEWLDGMLRKPPYDKPTATFWRRHRHAEIINRWASVVGADQVTAIVVDEQDHNRLLRQFEALAGLPEGVLEQQPRVNASLTWPEAELVRQLNIAYREDEWPDTVYRKVIRQGVVDAFMWRPGEPSGPSIPTPQWALEMAAELGAETAKEIAASGVRVVGDLDSLGRRPEPSEGSEPPATISADIAALAVRAAINSTRKLKRPKPRTEAAADSMPPKWRRAAGRARRRLTRS